MPYDGIPATLVWLPTSGKSTAPPKLAPFPSLDLHKRDNCDTIQWAKGMDTDTDGRLWALDLGSSDCPSKLWIFDLANNDTTERVHQFPDTVVPHSEISVSELKNEGGSAAVKLIGEWTESPYRMVIDNDNVLYAAFYFQNYLSKWNISEPFREQRFHEVGGGLDGSYPFTFSLDADDTLWVMERNVIGGEARHKLLKAAVGATSHLSSPSTDLSTP
ncbi:Hypothetical predicted protein [Cloeon dipterum]|uniref:Bee-milk protein n=1 Tax=Cloeon dipterum TaxID=197152 RepID=A0A8S1DQW2_9INSE|nr:Hypothetical predicted protein [Cloeon dipterum]